MATPNEFLDLKTGKLRKVHPSLAKNQAWLASRSLVIPPEAKMPPIVAPEPSPVITAPESVAPAPKPAQKAASKVTIPKSTPNKS